MPPGGPTYQPYGPPPGYPRGYGQPGAAPAFGGTSGYDPAPAAGYAGPAAGHPGGHGAGYPAPPGFGGPPGMPPVWIDAGTAGYGVPPGPPAVGYGQPVGSAGHAATARPVPGYPPAIGYGQPAAPAAFAVPVSGPSTGYPPVAGHGGPGSPSGAYAPPGRPHNGAVPSAFLPAGVPGFGPPGVAGPSVVIDVGRTNARKAVIGASVAGVIGLVVVGSGVTAAVDGGAAAGIIGVVIGLLFLVLPVGLVVRRDKVFRPQHLVFDAVGLRWDDPRGAPWMVPWTELAAVSISKHSPKQVGPESIQDKIVGAASDKIAGERAHVRVDFHPVDPAFAGRHPEIGHLWERQGVRHGYRLPLGSNVKFIPLIAQAMGRFAPHLYRGVNATEGFYGLS